MAGNKITEEIMLSKNLPYNTQNMHIEPIRLQVTFSNHVSFYIYRQKIF